MTQRILFLGLLLSVVLGHQANAQTRLGIKGGLSKPFLPEDALVITDEGGISKYRLSIDNAKYGLQLGMFLQAQFGVFFIQPEVLFNTSTIDYAIEDLQAGTPPEVYDEMYRNLDVPFLLGLKFGPVRFGGGPVGHIYLDNTSDLFSTYKETAQYKQDFDVLTWGWQAGLGIDIWKLHIDARYEQDLENFGQHLSFYGNAYEFSDPRSRILVSAGISF